MMASFFISNRLLPSFGRPLTAIGLIVAAMAVQAQAPAPWPTKPISLVVTYPPGGGADAMARLIAPQAWARRWART
jgi:tripartite-type tricarboxylate transporter receptor subunit TctC